MKRCPLCRRDYADETLNFCLDDGSSLVEGPANLDARNEPVTAILSSAEPAASGSSSGSLTEILPSDHADSTGTNNSIAVLPFANLSPDVENEYFCDGLAEELLNALAKIDGLKVAARTSAFAFKGKHTNVTEIARILGVRTVLEGSVRRSGDRLRITVQLISTSDGYHLWSERYDREMRDIFDVQDEITLAVVDALKITLFGEEKGALVKRYTDNTEVYELYLQGRYHYHKYTPEGWLKAIEFFERTIEAEPDYAPAYAKLSAAIAFCWFFGVISSDDAMTRWKEAALRALELDERMDDAYESLARKQFYYDWNWSEGERSFRRGLELNPNNAELHAQYGLSLVALRRFEEAHDEAAKALDLDPLSILINLQVGWLYLFSGRADDSIRLMRKILEIEPNSFSAHCQMGAALSVKREFKGALRAFQKSLELGKFQINLSNLGSLYALLGKREEAAAMLEQLIELRKHEPVAALDIARVLSAMGETDKALEWLEKAVEERNGGLVFIRSRMSGFTPATRSDPRFAEVIKRIGLPE